MKVNPYLMFNGNCGEAFRYYEKALGGTIDFMMKNSEAPADAQMPGGNPDLVMHASLRIGDQSILASDCPPEYYEKTQGQFVSLTVDTPGEAERIYDALSEKANITMPLQETFWSPKFAMLVDRFGTPWMINTDKPMA
jgi:PhnB protein